MPPSGTRYRRIPSAISLALAVGAGCAWMADNGAPVAYAAINGAALVIGLVLATGLARMPPRLIELTALWAAPALAALALALGPEVDGVRRWIGVGGFAVHAAILAGPAFAVAAARSPSGSIVALAGVTLALMLALQPDFGTTLALGLALAAVAVFTPRPGVIIALLAAAAASVWTAGMSDGPAPVPFVEGVIRSMLDEPGPRSVTALAGLAFAVVVPALTLRARDGGIALSAWMAGLVAASLAGPFPTPLIGYGAAAIVGYALGLGMPERGAK